MWKRTRHPQRYAKSPGSSRPHVRCGGARFPSAWRDATGPAARARNATRAGRRHKVGVRHNARVIGRRAYRTGPRPAPGKYGADKAVVHQVCGETRHPAPGARRAEAAPLARERDQHVLLARVAAEAGEAARELPAGEELTQLLLDEARQAVAVAARTCLGEKGLEMFVDEPVQRAALERARAVAGWRDPARVRGTGARREVATRLHAPADCGWRARWPDPGVSRGCSVRLSVARAGCNLASHLAGNDLLRGVRSARTWLLLLALVLPSLKFTFQAFDADRAVQAGRLRAREPAPERVATWRNARRRARARGAGAARLGALGRVVVGRVSRTSTSPSMAGGHCARAGPGARASSR